MLLYSQGVLKSTQKPEKPYAAVIAVLVAIIVVLVTVIAVGVVMLRYILIIECLRQYFTRTLQFPCIVLYIYYNDFKNKW